MENATADREPAGHSKSRSLLGAWALGVACAGAVIAGGAARAAESAAETRFADVRIGFGGCAKTGCWTPLSVDLQGLVPDTASVVVTVPDHEGNLVRLPLRRVENAIHGPQFEGLVQIGRLDAGVNLEVRDNDVVLANVRVSPAASDPWTLELFRRDTEFWGLLGSSPGFEQAGHDRNAEVWRQRGRRAPPAVKTMDLNWSQLPSDADGWESLDVLVLDGEGLRLGPEQSATLERWTSRGGRLVILLGPATSTFLAGPLAAWTPFQVEGSRQQTQFDAVRSLVPGSSDIPRLNHQLEAAILAPAPTGGIAGPVWARGAFGTGTVVAFAMDFTRPPLSTWQELPGLCRWLTQSESTRAEHIEQESELTATGVSDLGTQLISDLDQFSSVQRTSFQRILGWTVFWIIVAGPLDYLVVHRVFRRPHLTWITLPVWITVAIVTGMQAATAANAIPLSMNQIDLIDVDPERGVVRGQSWMTFYSGRTARYRVSATAESSDTEARIGWLGKPEESLRGMYRQGGTTFGSPSYEVNPDRTVIDRLPVRVWSSAAVAAEWEQVHPKNRKLIDGELRDSGAGRLKGVLWHSLPGPLTDWIIVYRNFAYYPDVSGSRDARPILAPGLEWRPEDGRQTTLKYFLTGHREVLRKEQHQQNPSLLIHVEAYDRLERDPAHLLRTVLLHKAMGGSDYTGLTNYLLAKLDASRIIELNQAILIARTTTRTTQYRIDDQAIEPVENWGFVRAVLPVKPLSSSSQAPDESSSP